MPGCQDHYPVDKGSTLKYPTTNPQRSFVLLRPSLGRQWYRQSGSGTDSQAGSGTDRQAVVQTVMQWYRQAGRQ
jgi:hypothetical protein